MLVKGATEREPGSVYWHMNVSCPVSLSEGVEARYIQKGRNMLRNEKKNIYKLHPLTIIQMASKQLFANSEMVLEINLKWESSDGGAWRCPKEILFIRW